MKSIESRQIAQLENFQLAKVEKEPFWINNIYTILEIERNNSWGKISTTALSPIISVGSTPRRESVRGVTSITPLG